MFFAGQPKMARTRVLPEEERVVARAGCQTRSADARRRWVTGRKRRLRRRSPPIFCTGRGRERTLDVPLQTLPRVRVECTDAGEHAGEEERHRSMGEARLVLAKGSVPLKT